MAQNKVVGFTLMVAGVGLSALGAWFVFSRRADQLAGGELGRARVLGNEKKNGMKLTHHRDDVMPIHERVRILQDLTAKSVKDPSMRKLALKITRGCEARDGECEARAIYDWIRKNIRYTGDIGPHALWHGGPVEGVDLFQSAARTVEFGGGDCDDHAILGCTLGLHNGMACKYRVTSPNRGKKDDYTHIYAMLGLPKMNPRKWVPIDTTLPGQRFNFEPPHAKHLDFVA